MLRSMFAAVSGLRSHQTMMDVVGNNISNVNTAGYKASRTTFQDAMNQVIRGSSAIQDDRGGTNPMQVGLGAQVSSVDAVLGQGSIQLTGRNMDVALQGEGYFIMEIGGQDVYSRAGALQLDASGALVGPSGARVMGWMPDANGAINTQEALEAITLPTGQSIAPVATEDIVLGGNLSAGTAVAGTVVSSINVIDALGTPHSMTFTFTKDAANTWTLSAASADATTGPTITAGDEDITFDVATGELTAPADGLVNISVDYGSGAQAITVNLLENGQQLTQYGGATTAEARSQDGSEMGFLRGFDFGADGTITGRFSNGMTKALGAIAVATFNNPSGLQRQGESVFVDTLNSGQAIIGLPGEGDAGVLAPGSLEMSNVDMAQEFTNLIIAQRGFQANARSITASDEMLSDIVNLKR